MSSLPLHPSIVHVPIALAILMPIVIGGLLLAWWRDWLPRRGMLVALLLQAVLVGSAFAAMRTGEAEEERVEDVLASEATLEAHEEAAEVFLWAAIATLGLLAAATFVRARPLAQTFAAAAVLGALAVTGLGYRVGHAGGTLVYAEGAASAYTNTAAAAGDGVPLQQGEGNHHDDDDDDDD